MLFYPPTKNGTQKTLDSQLDAGVTASATLNNVTSIQNKPGVIVINRIDANGNELPAASREYIKYTGTSGSTLTTLTRNVDGSTTDQDHAVGSIVEFIPDVTWSEGIVGALENLVTPSTGAVDPAKVVTPTGTQTLTNKTIDASNNTLTGVVTTSSTDTLTNKTLTSPKIGTSILDTNGNELALLTATGSAVNEITLTNAATGNAPQISATGGDTNISLDLRGKGEGVTKGGIRYQSNTTNSNQNGVWIQSGWGFFLGDGDTSATEAITFPTAFTTILSVVASGIGYKDSSDPSGIGDFGDYGVYANANSISTTGCNIALNIPAGTIGATRRVGYSWIAIGI